MKSFDSVRLATVLAAAAAALAACDDGHCGRRDAAGRRPADCNSGHGGGFWVGGGHGGSGDANAGDVARGGFGGTAGDGGGHGGGGAGE